MDKSNRQNGFVVPKRIAKVLIEAAKTGKTIYGKSRRVTLYPAKTIKQLCKERGVPFNG